jgi:hypothetical protein
MGLMRFLISSLTANAMARHSHSISANKIEELIFILILMYSLHQMSVIWNLHMTYQKAMIALLQQMKPGMIQQVKVRL